MYYSGILGQILKWACPNCLEKDLPFMGRIDIIALRTDKELPQGSVLPPYFLKVIPSFA